MKKSRMCSCGVSDSEGFRIPCRKCPYFRTKDSKKYHTCCAIKQVSIAFSNELGNQLSFTFSDVP